MLQPLEMYCLACLWRQESGPNIVEKDSAVYSSIQDGIVQQHSMGGLLCDGNTRYELCCYITELCFVKDLLYKRFINSFV